MPWHARSWSRAAVIFAADAGPSDNRQPVQPHSRRMWPVRLVAALQDRVLRGSPWWRRGLWYAVVGLLLAVALPVDPVLGFFAWLLLPAGFALLCTWVVMSELDTRWVMWRRGVTVRARFETVWHGAGDANHLVHFRTLDGREVTAHCARVRRDEIAYDPRDPSRVLAPTRVAWLGYALVAFLLTGFWGALLCIPAVIWLTRLLTLPF
ncbi:hypothetical protein [Streptomyces xanthochromogenes]|uniref:hypothetical protein n=1 Tax=Streptomyces xanthochromogenes TaxID=67384 RepID=UPI003809FF94